MKKYFVLAVSVMLACQVAAQSLHLDKSQSSKKPFYTHTQLDVNYLNYDIGNINTNGLGVNMALVFRDRWATGLALDITGGKNLERIDIPVADGVFEYTQISWLNEIILHPTSKIDFSFPLKLGYAHSSFNNSEDFYFGRTLFSSKGTSLDDHFFVVEPGVNVMVHLWRDIDVNVGGSYRFTSDTGLTDRGLNFVNYALHMGFRFRVAHTKSK